MGGSRGKSMEDPSIIKPVYTSFWSRLVASRSVLLFYGLDVTVKGNMVAFDWEILYG